MIDSLDGKKVDDSAALSGAVDGHKPGDQVDVGVRRDGTDHTLQAKLTDRPRSRRPANAPGPDGAVLRQSPWEGR